MKKNLILHIGSHKTATTFLQGSFANSQPALTAMGILYPQAGRIHDAHFKLCWDLKNFDLKQAGLTTLPHWAALFAEIEASPLQTVLLSAETFGWSTDVSRLSALSDQFNVTVVYYLRSPESHLESFYNQLVKDFGTRETRTLERYMAEEVMGILDTSKLLKPWEEMFGRAAIKLRLFGDQYLPDGILADFLRTIGHTDWPSFGGPNAAVHHKVSLPPDALDFLRLSNPWSLNQQRHYDFVVKLAKLATAQPADFQETRAGIMSYKARFSLRVRMRASHLQAVQSYMGQHTAPFLPADTPDFPGFETRLAEANVQVMGKVAALLRPIM